MIINHLTDISFFVSYLLGADFSLPVSIGLNSDCMKNNSGIRMCDMQMLLRYPLIN